MDEKNSEKYNVAKLLIEDDEKIYANDPLTNEKVEIYDDIIVEFGYDPEQEHNFNWKPYRFRRDKTSLYKNGKEVFGNGEKTANDIFKSIQLPITEEMITTGNIPVLEESGTIINQYPYYVRNNNEEGKRERMPYQNFHNHYVKYQLLYFSSPCYINEYKTGFHGKILDLCCGRGVDINKIKRARYSEIVGIDIDSQNIKDAQEFYKSFMPPPKAFYVRGDTRKLIMPEQACAETEFEKMYTKKFIPTKYLFDTVSLQFCFHYFFEDEITFRTILQNMNDNLKIGGFVIGTTFDGERVYNLLQKTDSISGKKYSGEIMWKIEKKYNTKFSFTDKRGNFGKKIDVFVKTIGAVHSEYLVNFNYMTKIMQDYGFSLVFIKPFEELYNELMEGKNKMDLSNRELEKDMESVKKMSEDEKRFSFLSSAFMFKKEKNSPDSLMKKLVELMEKKHKVRGMKASKVDANTEHIIEDVELED
jgi:SAM-dependent methyltransferase